MEEEEKKRTNKCLFVSSHITMGDLPPQFAQLIEQTISRVSSGTQVTTRAKDAFADVVRGVGLTDTSMGQIATELGYASPSAWAAT